MTGRVLKIKRKNNWLQGVYKSPKSRKLHYFKSSWELSFYKILDYCDKVKCWESECVKIPYKIGRKNKWYIPDVLINNKLLIEVKPKVQITWLINKLKFKSALDFCKNRKWEFKIITKELLNPIYLTEQLKNIE